MKENWIDIPGYEGLYMASNFGFIKNTKTNRVLKNCVKKTGYHQIALYSGKKKKYFNVHRLIALTFLKKPIDKNQVNHLSGIKADNSVGNLEWCDSKENSRHSVVVLGNGVGERNGNSKLTESNVLEIKILLKYGMSQKRIAEIFKVHPSIISDINLNKIWRQYGNSCRT